MKKRSSIYILGILAVMVLILVGVMGLDIAADSLGKMQDKPRYDLPDDIPWDRIPWQQFPDDFPYDAVPWDKFPEDTVWEDIPWLAIPWVTLPWDIVTDLPLKDIPWDILPDVMPWNDLPRDLNWGNVPWATVPWAELPENFPYDEVPWDDLPGDFNWQAVTCEHEYEWTETIVPPTCAAKGKDLYTCTLCGMSQLKETPPTEDHIFSGEWLTGDLPTCVAAGYLYRVCERCKIGRETMAVEPTGIHIYDPDTGKCQTCDRQQLTIRGCSLEGEYSGKPLKASDPLSYDIVFGRLKEGHEAHCVYSESLTMVGTAANVFTVEILDESGADATEGYELTILTGTLTVTPKSITVETLSAEGAFFEGATLYCDKIKPVELAAGDQIEIVKCAELAREGSCDNVLQIKIVNSGGEDVTHCYAVAWIWGKLTLKRD